MTKTFIAKTLVAAAALLSGTIPAALMAQSNTYSYPLGQRPIRPNFQPIVQQPMACGSGAGGAVLMGPCQGPVGTPIQVRLTRNVGGAPALLSFKAVVSRGVPARVHVRLQRYGNGYVMYAPQQLCIQGGGSWEAELILATGQNVGTVGGFTPTNCPR